MPSHVDYFVIADNFHFEIESIGRGVSQGRLGAKIHGAIQYSRTNIFVAQRALSRIRHAVQLRSSRVTKMRARRS